MYYPLSPFPSEYLLGYQAASFLFQSIFDPFIQDHFIYFAWGIEQCSISMIFYLLPVFCFIWRWNYSCSPFLGHHFPFPNFWFVSTFFVSSHRSRTPMLHSKFYLLPTSGSSVVFPLLFYVLVHHRSPSLLLSLHLTLSSSFCFPTGLNAPWIDFRIHRF